MSTHRRSPMDGLLTWLAVLAERPRWTLTILAAATAGAIALLPLVRIEPDLSEMLPANHPALAALKDPELGGKSSRSLFVMVQGEDLESKTADWASTLEASPWIERVDFLRSDLIAEQVAGEPWKLLLAAPPAILDRLERQLSSPQREAAIREAAALARVDPIAGRRLLTEDPLGIRWILNEAAQLAGLPGLAPHSPLLLNKAQDAALLRVTGHESPFQLDASRGVMAAAESALAEGSPQFLGGYAVAVEDSTRIAHDLKSSLQWSLPGLILFLMFATRSWLLPHVMMLPVALALLWTVGFGGNLLGPLSPLAVSGIAIILGLCVDYSIHYMGALQSAPTLLAANLGVGRIIVYAVITSSAAFMSFGWGAFEGMRSFGMLLAFGLVAAAFICFLLLPPIVRAWRPMRTSQVRAVSRSWLLGFSATRAGLLAGLLLVAAAATGWVGLTLGAVRFSADPAELRPQQTRVSAAAHAIEASFGFSPFGVQALVPATAELEQLRTAVGAVQALAGVAHASGAHESVLTAAERERLQRFDERIGGWRRAVEHELTAMKVQPAIAADALNGLELVLDWRAATAPTPWAWRGQSYWIETLLLDSMHGSLAARKSLLDQVAALLPPGTLLVDPLGVPAEFERMLTSDLTLAMLLAALAVVAMARLALGSWRLSLVALIPVCIRAGAVLALLTWTGRAISPANFIALPFILGLGIDDGLHLTALRAQGRKRGESRSEVPEQARSRTCIAIRNTTMTTLIGFGSLVSADSPGIASLGAMVACGVLICYLATVLILPRLLFNDRIPGPRVDDRLAAKRVEAGGR